MASNVQKSGSDSGPLSASIPPARGLGLPNSPLARSLRLVSLLQEVHPQLKDDVIALSDGEQSTGRRRRKLDQSSRGEFSFNRPASEVQRTFGSRPNRTRTHSPDR